MEQFPKNEEGMENTKEKYDPTAWEAAEKEALEAMERFKSNTSTDPEVIKKLRAEVREKRMKEDYEFAKYDFQHEAPGLVEEWHTNNAHMYEEGGDIDREF
ncbi:hypothetical protein KW782_04535 [Candidatus Parcubacteria bacterium]|nr:hypothetical protein [Candidatus Parcubacteria bacterium]